MNPTLLKGMIALVPSSMILSGPFLSVFRRKNAGSFLQLVGTGCLIIVVLTNVCEGLRLFPSMQKQRSQQLLLEFVRWPFKPAIPQSQSWQSN